VWEFSDGTKSFGQRNRRSAPADNGVTTAAHGDGHHQSRGNQDTVSVPNEPPSVNAGPDDG
jgi:hypothetical protein